ncbi:MAG TPA: DUF86 domain-containing protein [Desulfuromonadales bacterium]|nr:DUF86 domain-containing protein [Desulfuromonadales bacterium]
MDRIAEYTAGMSYEAFLGNRLVIDAVVRNLEVIGEAARHIPDDVQTRFPHVPWVEMKGMRNILIHEYFGVSLEIVWKTVQENLPPVEPKLRELLKKV